MPREQQGRAGHIDDVIDIEPVPWPLLIPDARDRAVEAVAEPIRHKRYDHAKGRPVRYTVGGERGAGTGHRNQAERRQVIGVDEAGKSPGDPDERLLFRSRENAQVLARMHGCDSRVSLNASTRECVIESKGLSRSLGLGSLNPGLSLVLAHWSRSARRNTLPTMVLAARVRNSMRAGTL